MITNPLSPAAVKAMRDALYELSVCEQKMDDCENAGIDCTQQRAECEHLKQSLTKMLSVYGKKTAKSRKDADE